LVWKRAGELAAAANSSSSSLVPELVLLGLIVFPLGSSKELALGIILLAHLGVDLAQEVDWEDPQQVPRQVQ
jgi:hypothetical protein